MPGRSTPVPTLDQLVPPAPAWQAQARCNETDPEAFYPERGGTNLAARGVCAECPVRAACLAWAVENGEKYGMWGGLSEAQRGKLIVEYRRRQKAARKAAEKASA